MAIYRIYIYSSKSSLRGTVTPATISFVDKLTRYCNNRRVFIRPSQLANGKTILRYFFYAHQYMLNNLRIPFSIHAIQC